MKGGGLHVAPTALADTEGIAFGLGTQLDIGSLSVYSRGRAADGTIDMSDAMAMTGIHLADAATGGAWMLADLDRHPGLINAATDATGSYLHLQVGWPTTAERGARRRADHRQHLVHDARRRRRARHRDQPRLGQHRVACRSTTSTSS